MTRKISAHEATVRTAAVEIKALTIDGKQVTLAVFRQLPKEPVINENSGNLNGLVWGRVNYFFGGCNADHLHVVWQTNDELFRSCTYAVKRDQDPCEAKDSYGETLARLEKTLLLEIISKAIECGEEIKPLPRECDTWTGSYLHPLVLKVDGVAIEFSIDDRLYNLLRYPKWNFESPPNPLKKFRAEHCAALKICEDHEAIQAAVLRCIEHWQIARILCKKLDSIRQQTYYEILNSPQLYIAV